MFHSQWRQRAARLPARTSLQPSTTRREPLLFLYPRWAGTGVSPTESADDAFYDIDPLANFDDLLAQSDGKAAVWNHRFRDSWRHKPSTVGTTFQSHLIEPEPEDEVHTEAIDRVGLPDFPSTSDIQVQDGTQARVVDPHWKSVLKAHKSRSEHDARVSRARKEQVRDAANADGYWKRALDTLLAASRKDKYTGVIKSRMTISDGMRGFFNTPVDEVLVALRMATDCQIHSAQGLAPDGSFKGLTISGPSYALDKAKEVVGMFLRIKLVDPMIGNTAECAASHPNENIGSIDTPTRLRKGSETADCLDQWSSPTPNGNNLIRVTWSRRRLSRPPRRADKIPKPSSWSKISLSNYLADIIGSDGSGGWPSRLYGTRDNHVDCVTRLMMDLFNKEQLRACLTFEACFIAMRFLVKHRKLREARKVLEQAESAGTLFSADLYNVLLESAARAEDPYNYVLLLEDLVRKVEPNWFTWLTLLIGTPSLSRKLNIIRVMDSIGLRPDLSALRKMMREVGALIAVALLDKGSPMRDIIARFDKALGTQAWLTISLANEFVKDLCKRGDMNAALCVLNVMSDRGLRPNNVSLNTLLTWCTLHRNDRGAVDVVGVCWKTWRLGPDTVGMTSLFRLFWHRKFYNSLRVVWRHACLGGLNTSKMARRLQIKSLNTTTSSDRTRDWHQQCLRFVVGIHNEKSQTEPINRAAFAAQEMIENDRVVYRHFRPQKPFAEDLARALELDKEWVDMQTWRNDLEWKISHGIHVSIQPLPGHSIDDRTGSPGAI